MKGGCKVKELLQHCSTETGLDEKEVQAVIDAFLDGIVRELSHGHAVDLGDDFGVFSARLRIGKVAEGSPRKPKESRYLTLFRENKGMRSRMKLPAGSEAEAEAVRREMK